MRYLEGPEEVGCVLEVLPHGEDLMNQILHTDEVFLSQRLFNDRVGGEWGPAVIHLGKSSLVNQLTNALLIRVSPCNVGLTDSEHVNCGLLIYNYKLELQPRRNN